MGASRLTMLLILAPFVFAAACGAGAAPTSTPPPATSPTSTTVPQGQSLVIYSGRSESLIAPIIKQFSDASGIKVDVKYGSTGAIAATLLEEGARTPADLFFAQDPGGLGSVKQLLAPLPEDILKTVPGWARSPEGKWVGISGRARVVVYNTNRLKETDLPDSIEGFTDTKWKGRIGWAPTNSSLQSMVAGMRVLWGEQRTLDWLKGIQANEPRVYSGNAQAVAGVAASEVDVAFVNHYYLHQYLAQEGEGYKARNYFTRAGDAGSVVLVAGAGITSTAKNRQAAERFIRFMLSVPGQEYFAGKTFEYPLVEGVAHHRLLPDIDAIKKPEIDISRLEDIVGTQNLMRQAGNIP